MRLSSAFAIFCLAASASPSLAAPSILSERADTTTTTTTTTPATEQPASDHATSKAAIGGLAGAVASIGIITAINSFYTWMHTNHTRRDVLESLDARINEELAARAHHGQELLTRLLNDLD